MITITGSLSGDVLAPRSSPSCLGLLLGWVVAAEPTSERAHHAVHGLLLGSLHHRSFFLEPLLSVLADLLLELHVVPLTTLTGNVLQHLALCESLGGVLLTIGRHHHVHVAGLEAEHVTQGTNTGTMLVLVSELLGLELLAGNSLTAGELGGNVLAVERLDHLADVGVLHGMNVLKEGNEVDEVLVVFVTLPGVKNNGVIGLVADMLGLGVDDDHLGQVTVKVGEVLNC
ncbi:hypothetical protein HG531_008724 [Fusarium graminearum]|nr:hypothetical protein HG531_008724 [Fusarium graminearum]